MNHELEQAEGRLARLQAVEVHLRAALRDIPFMPEAERGTKVALRIVARQAGKAMARVKKLEQDAKQSEDEGAGQ